MKKTERKSIESNLDKYDALARDFDTIEVTEWSRGEGVDVAITTGYWSRMFFLSYGELKAIETLVKELRKNDDEPSDDDTKIEYGIVKDVFSDGSILVDCENAQTGDALARISERMSFWVEAGYGDNCVAKPYNRLYSANIGEKLILVRQS